MMNNKVLGLLGLAAFAMMQLSACFVAGAHTEGLLSVFFYTLGGVSCLFGMALNFLLLILALDVFGGVFASMASSMGKKEDVEEEEAEEDVT